MWIELYSISWALISELRPTLSITICKSAYLWPRMDLINAGKQRSLVGCGVPLPEAGRILRCYLHWAGPTIKEKAIDWCSPDPRDFTRTEAPGAGGWAQWEKRRKERRVLLCKSIKWLTQSLNGGATSVLLQPLDERLVALFELQIANCPASLFGLY